MVSIRMTSAVVKDSALLHEKILLLGMHCHTSYQPPDCNSIGWLVRSMAMTNQHSWQELLAVFISRV